MYFFSHDVTFLDGRCMCFSRDWGQNVFFFLSEGKRVIIILKPQTPTLLSLVDCFSPIAVVESLSQTLESQES